LWIGAIPVAIGAFGACGGSTTTVEQTQQAEGGLPGEGTGDASVDSPFVSVVPDGSSGGADAHDATDTTPNSDDSAAAADSSDGGATDAPPPCVPGSCVVSFTSGPGWLSYDGTLSSTGASFTLAQVLGPAVDVCLNAADPANCPSAALLYGYPGTGHWTGGDTFPAASWIWRSDVAPASTAPGQVAIFVKTFMIGANATGSIQVAVDDYAAVFVNDVAIGSLGSTSDVSVAAPAHTTGTVLDLTPALQAGPNTVVVAAQNGPWGCSSTPCPYTQDPAGVVFQGAFRW
jgi:hypothetical protein